jgi:hypothetical protein
VVDRQRFLEAEPGTTSKRWRLPQITGTDLEEATAAEVAEQLLRFYLEQGGGLRHPRGHKSPTRSHSHGYPPGGHPGASAPLETAVGSLKHLGQAP